MPIAARVSDRSSESDGTQTSTVVTFTSVIYEHVPAHICHPTSYSSGAVDPNLHGDVVHGQPHDMTMLELVAQRPCSGARPSESDATLGIIRLQHTNVDKDQHADRVDSRCPNPPTEEGSRLGSRTDSQKHLRDGMCDVCASPTFVTMSSSVTMYM